MAGKIIIDGFDLPVVNKCKIFANGIQVALISHLDKKTITINSDTEIYGKVGINPKGKSIVVRDNKVTVIHIKWDRILGKAILIVDSESDIDNYLLDEDEIPKYDLDGVHGRYLRVYEDRCVFGARTDFSSFVAGNVADGEKAIYYNDILAVQFKKIGDKIVGLRLDTAISTMNNQSNNFFNDNSFTFKPDLQIKAKEVLDFIQKKVAEAKCNSNNPISTMQEHSPIEELKKYKELLDSNIITQEEFDAKKKQLLGI